jgi:adenosylcobinamide-GDP ribazoletransferase
VAVAFLTRVPVPLGNEPVDAITLRRSVVFFPLVGALIGCFTAGVLWGAWLIWPIWIAVPLALAAEAMLCGGFHEDAVADFFDAYGGGWTKEQTLRILKDSRLGSYGALGMLLAVSLRAGATMGLPGLGWADPTDTTDPWGPLAGGLTDPWPAMAAVVFAACLGRWVILPAMAILPPEPTRVSLARDVGQSLGWPLVLLGSLLALPGLALWVGLAPGRALLGLAGAVLLMGLMLQAMHRRLGGVVGDGLGCLCYLTQVAALLGAAVGSKIGGV